MRNQVVTNCVGEVEVTYHRAHDPLEACVVNSFISIDDLSNCETDVCAIVGELDVLLERIL